VLTGRVEVEWNFGPILLGGLGICSHRNREHKKNDKACLHDYSVHNASYKNESNSGTRSDFSAFINYRDNSKKTVSKKSSFF